MAAGTSLHAALLRGINLGSRRISMPDLAAIFADTGCEDVRTYIQSGNVVYRAAARLARRVPGLVEAAIVERYGFEAPIVTRTAAELSAVVCGNPYPDQAAADPKSVHVAFLRDRPAAAKVATLDPDRSPPDAFVVQGREVYLHLPNGAARSKLTAPYLDTRLDTISTARNWRTVVTLLEMVRTER